MTDPNFVKVCEGIADDKERLYPILEKDTSGTIRIPHEDVYVNINYSLEGTRLTFTSRGYAHSVDIPGYIDWKIRHLPGVTSTPLQKEILSETRLQAMQLAIQHSRGNDIPENLIALASHIHHFLVNKPTTSQ